MFQIISKIEALKRRSIVFDEPIPLPELNGQSTILNDALILQVSFIFETQHENTCLQGF